MTGSVTGNGVGPGVLAGIEDAVAVDVGEVTAGMAVVDVVFQQEHEVTGTDQTGGSQGIVTQNGTQMVGMAAKANVAGSGVHQQPLVTVGRIDINKPTVLAVVHGVATVTGSDATIMESPGRHGGESHGDENQKSLSHSKTSNK